MNSEIALEMLESMVVSGKLQRLSSVARKTKSIAFQTNSGRNFALEIGGGATQGYSKDVKLVCERAPKGTPLQWSEIAKAEGIRLVEKQFRGASYQAKGYRLSTGLQMSAYVDTASSLCHFLDWYESADT